MIFLTNRNDLKEANFSDSQKWQARLFHADKLPMILQAEAAECGLACLAMVAAAHGQRHTLSDLRRKFSASLKGTTLKSVMDMADGLGLVGRPLLLEVEELANLWRNPPRHCLLARILAKGEIGSANRYTDHSNSREGSKRCWLVQGDTAKNAAALRFNDFRAEEGHA